MNTLGIVGGIGPESTIEYYRLIIAEYRMRRRDGTYPTIIINSIDLTELIALLESNQLDKLVDHLVDNIKKLARAGADIGALASNTPHIVFEEVSRQSPIPLTSIVEATCAETARQGLKRVGLFGSRFTMQARFYQDIFSRAGISVVSPDADQRDYIHNKYMSELIHGILLDETRQQLLLIIDRMIERDGIDALILGGTELPLILTGSEHNGIPLLDTTRIHVDRIVAELLA